MERTTHRTLKILVAEDKDAIISVPPTDASPSAFQTAEDKKNPQIEPDPDPDDMDNQLFDEPTSKISLKVVGGSLQAIHGISDTIDVKSHTAVFALRRGENIIIGMDSLTCKRQPDDSYEPDDKDFDKSIELYDTVFLGGCGNSIGAFEILKPIIPERLHGMFRRKPRRMLRIADSVCRIINGYCREINVRPPPTLVSFMLVGICRDGDGIFTIESDGHEFHYEHQDVGNLAGGSGSDAMVNFLEAHPFEADFSEIEAVNHTFSTIEHAVNSTEDCGGNIRVFSITRAGHTPHFWKLVEGDDGSNFYQKEV